MISEFQDLSNKIDLLADMIHMLRRENAELRQTNAALNADHALHVQRMCEVQQRVEALLEKVPDLMQAESTNVAWEETGI